MEFGGYKWKQQVNGIGKAVIKEMEGGKRKERTGTLGFFRLVLTQLISDSN